MKRAPRVAAALSVLLGSASAVSAEESPPFEQYLYSSFHAAFSPTLSPSGTEVAFLIGITGTAQLWKTDIKGSWPTQLTFLNEPIEAPEWASNTALWSPDGARIAFGVDPGGSQKNQIYVVPAAGGAPERLSPQMDASYRLGPWAPDGSQLSWASNERDDRYYDVYIWNLKNKTPRRVYETDKNIDVLDWSADGKCLLIKQLNSDIVHELLVVDVATGKDRLITPHEGNARYDGRFGSSCNTVYALSDAGAEFIGLTSINTSNAAATWLVQRSHDAESLAFSASKGLLAISWNMDGYSEIKLYNLSGKEVARPVFPHGVISELTFSKDGRRLFYSFAGPRERSSVGWYGLADKKIHQATKVSTAGVRPETLVEPQVIRYKSFDGLTIAGLLYLPAGKDTKNMPLVVSIHGGPESQERPVMSSVAQYMVSQGFAVFAPNIRGSTGYGKTFDQLDNGRKRADAMRDIVQGVDHLVRQGIADPAKVAIIGGSYGGFAVLYLATHYPKRWAAAVDMFGIASFETYFENTSPARVPLRAMEYGDPVRDKDFLREISPLYSVDQIEAPLMVVQGANDPVVPKIESDQIVDSMKKRGRPAEYLLFPDEGHGLSKRENILKAYPAIVEFLKKYLTRAQ
jgi:dipeptidyl aminopeptidase/acylaminoacyl peptidase